MTYNVKRDNNINIIILEQIVMAIFIGCIGWLSSYKVMSRLISENDNIWVMVAKLISILLFTYFVSCFAHELGHLIGALVMGYKVRFFVCGILLVIKDRNKYILKIKITRYILGGFIMLDLSSKIKNEKSYIRYSKDIKRISLAGIHMNLLIICICVLNGYFFEYNNITIMLMWINIATLIGGFAKNQDIWKAFAINKRDELVISFLVEELQVQEKCNSFCCMKIRENIIKTLQSAQYDVKLLYNLIQIIRHSIIYNENLPKEIVSFAYWLIENYSEINRNSKFMEKIMVKRLISEMNSYGLIDINNNVLIEYHSVKHPAHKVFKESSSYMIKIKLLDDRKLVCKQNNNGAS